MIRRSVSSWVSPGPRVPMPPPVRDRWVHSRVRRGSWYSSWASSTWRRPSWVCACWAKMSRISRLRSMTLTLSSSSSALCWAGRQLVVGDEHVEAGLALGLRPAPRPCPCRRTSSGRRGGGSATRRRRPRRPPWWRGWRARRASPRRSSPRRRRCRRRRGTPSRRAGSDSIMLVIRPEDTAAAPGAVDGRRTICRWISPSVRCCRPTGRPSTRCSRARRPRLPWRCRPTTGSTSSRRSLPSIPAVRRGRHRTRVSRGSWEWQPRTSTKSRSRSGSSPRAAREPQGSP